MARKAMNIAVFDIDGTLTQVDNRHDEYFAQAVEQTLGIHVSRSWNDYEYSTDSGIMREACVCGAGKPPSRKQIAAAQKLYLAKLSSLHTGGEQVPGASAILRTLNSHSDWVAALATGNWFAATDLKLKRVGIAVDSFPYATADDALDRKAIITLAVRRAAERLGRSGFERTVYVGDADWDVAAAYSLGMSFVQRGTRVKGAKSLFVPSHSLPDFRDQQAALDALTNASVPIKKGSPGRPEAGDG